MTNDEREARLRSDEIRTRIAFGVVAALSASGLAAIDGWTRFLPHVQIGAESAPAAPGFPVATLAATLVISLLRALDSRFGLELPGLVAEGAAAAFLCWMGCVAGLSFAFHLFQ